MRNSNPWVKKMQTSNTNNKKLLNKFNELEGSIVDKELGFTIHNDLLSSNEKKVTSKSNHPNILRAMTSLLIKYKMSAWSSFKKKINGLNKKSKFYLNKINKQKSKIELKAETIIKQFETEFDEQVNLEKVKIECEISRDEKFKSEVKKIFHTKNIVSTVESEDIRFDIDEFLNEDLLLFKKLKNNLSERQMDLNVFAVTVKSNLTENKITHKMTFELNQKGLKWAIFYSKFIMENMKAEMSARSGGVKGELLTNVTLGREKYIFTIEYRPTVQRKNINEASRDEKKSSLTELGI